MVHQTSGTNPVIPLANAGHGNFSRSRSKVVELIWIISEYLLVSNPLQLSSRIRVLTLRSFGANIGKGVLIRPRVRVKFPWNLEIGDNCWIGEGVWIHNQVPVVIESDVAVSQETFITTGSHDFRKSMDLVVMPIMIRSGAWITSRCMILQGVDIGQNALVVPASVVKYSLDANGVYAGNPAVRIGNRFGPS